MKYLLALLLLMSGLAFAQSSPKASSDTIAPASAAITAAQMSEKDYYKMMYEQAKESAQASNTQTWSALAVMGGLVGLVILIQSLSNYRINTSKINEGIATQGAEIQRAILGAASTQVAADLLATQTRVQELERQLRESINRELDRAKDAVTTLLSSQKELIMVNSAKIEVINKRGINALKIYLELAEHKITEDKYDEVVAWGLRDSLMGLSEPKELLKPEYDKLMNLMPYIKVRNPLLLSLLNSALDNLTIYEHIPVVPGVYTSYTRNVIKHIHI
jgi:hypothetical protein